MIFNDVSINSKWLHKEVKPQVEAILKELPTVKYATLFIAQYYDDQANDEVHGKVILSMEPLPEDFNLYGVKYENCAYFSRWHNKMDHVRELESFQKSGFGCLIVNTDYKMIESLQPYCKDNGDQNQDFNENYTPFAKWTLLDGGVMLEECGKILRPWLVGAVREEDY